MRLSPPKCGDGMHAVDTNVVVRYLTRDHAGQYARACALFDVGPISIATTVLLETEWVLRSAYDYPPAAIARAIRSLAGLPSVTVQEPALLKAALDLLEAGLDVVDAFHLAAADGCDAFMSFDRDLAKRAAGVGPVPVQMP
jgi:predicted nucleic acid-binding protein